MKNFIAYFSVLVFFISMIFGAGKLIAEQKQTAEKVKIVEEKVKELEKTGNEEVKEIKKESNETQKIVVEQSVKLEYIQKILENIDKKLEKENK